MGVNEGFYRRRLPHWQVDGAAHFITWRLEGALPPHIKGDFACVDEFLDAAETGPVWLNQKRIAELVVNALHYAERQLKLYDLLAWVVMANHVHIVVIPNVALARITKTVKGYTALEANRMLGLSGRFWQHESFDRWVRDRYELERIIRYVERNPVKAGLVPNEQDFPWSSASPWRKPEACATS
jgi:REP element-mobilizing transposase RayT